MVEYSLSLDAVFTSLADPTRRDILRRISERELSIGQIALPYHLGFAAISKHLMVLQHAKLITKKRRGRQQFVQLAPQALADAREYLLWYQRFGGNKPAAHGNHWS